MDTPEVVIELMLRIEDIFNAPAPPPAAPSPAVPTIS